MRESVTSLLVQPALVLDELSMSVRPYAGLPIGELVGSLLDGQEGDLHADERLHLTLVVRLPGSAAPAHVHLRAPAADMSDAGVRSRFLGELGVAYRELSSQVASGDRRHAELALRLHIEASDQQELPCPACGAATGQTLDAANHPRLSRPALSDVTSEAAMPCR